MMNNDGNDFSNKFKSAGKQPTPGQGGGQGQQVSVDPNSLTDIKCEECDSEFFKPVFKIKKMSKLIAPDGQERMFPIQLFICEECGAVPDVVKEQLSGFGG